MIRKRLAGGLALMLMLGLATLATPAGAQEKTAPKAKAQAKARAAAKDAPPAAGALDVNTADAKALKELPGVGEVMARRIIEGRPYKTVDDLTRADIPARVVEGLRGKVRVGSASAPVPASVAAKARAKAEMPEKGKAAESGPVNLNTATEEQLQTLPGVGPALAKAIVGARPFKAVDDLANVKGIGEAKLAELKPLVRLGGPAPAPKAAAAPKAEMAKDRPTSPRPVNLNAATEEQLQTLPGVGPALAKAIVGARPFKAVDELANVKGIGEAKLATLRPLVGVGSPGTSTGAPASASKKAAASKKADDEDDPTVVRPKLAAGQQIDINKATLAELEELLGIGPVKAQRIIEARPFEAPEDIMKVKGIKEKTFAKIKDHIRVR